MNLNKRIDFKVLDGIRGIAALYVVINHCRGNMLIGGSEYSKLIPIEDWSIGDKLFFGLLQFTSLGREFVVLFFVLSGFSIAYSLHNKPKISNFYFRRLVRLYSPYLAALIYAFFCYELTSSTLNLNGGSVFMNFWSIIKNLLYIPSGQMIPQFWSLPHEVIFYIIAPLIVIKIKKLSHYYIFSIIIFTFSLISTPLALTGTNIVFKFILDYNIYFALGIYLFHNLELILNSKMIRKSSIIIATVICIPLMVLIKYKLGEFNKFSGLLACLYSLILIPTFLKYSIKNKVLGFLGEISYTLYITHFASIYLISFLLIKFNIIEEQFSLTRWTWLVGVIFSILIAYPIYFISEKPSKILLKKLRLKN